MNTPFKITFRKGIKEEEYETILNNFKINSEKSKCENVEIINDRQLFVKNGFLFDLKLWNYMNVWTGVGRADICINRNKENHETEIIYKIDVSRFFLFYLILFFIMFLFDYFEFFGFQDNDFTYSFFIFFYLGFTFLSLIPIIIRQRSFFLRTLK